MGYWKEEYTKGNSRISKERYNPKTEWSKHVDFDIVQPQNELLIQWTPKVRTALRSSAKWFEGKFDSFVIRGKKSVKPWIEYKLGNSIRYNFRKEYGEITSVSFKFERHGVFVHKGVGRKYPISGKESIKQHVKDRVAVEWFNPVLDQYLPELADRIAQINANASINFEKSRIR